MDIAEPSVRDSAEQAAQLAPVLSQRRWEQEAETNIVERLQKAGLLAPVSDVEKVLDTVVNNLVVTSDLTFHRPVRARILLTSPLESFTIGHTIVLSRGLIDVLPDESSLAMMLAHELSHIVLGHRLVDTRFAYADRTMVDDADLFSAVSIRRDRAKELAADEKTMEMLEKSPYKDNLAGAGLFLRILAHRATRLPNLTQPHIGDQITDGDQILRLTALMLRSPELAPEQLDQVPALPLGARLVLDPWSNDLELLRTALAPGTAQEKALLAITPLAPYLKYVDDSPVASK